MQVMWMTVPLGFCRYYSASEVMHKVDQRGKVEFLSIHIRFTANHVCSDVLRYC